MPWQAWLVGAAGLVFLISTGTVADFMQSLVPGSVGLIRPAAWFFLVGGLFWAGSGVVWRAVHHEKTATQGQHMSKWGLVVAGVGLFVLTGGVNTALTLGSAVMTQVTAATSKGRPTVTIEQVTGVVPTSAPPHSPVPKVTP